MSLRPRFTGQWQRVSTGSPVSAGPRLYSVTNQSDVTSHGLRVALGVVAGWVKPTAPTETRDLDELTSMPLKPGESVVFRISETAEASESVRFFAKDSAGWWHMYVGLLGEVSATEPQLFDHLGKGESP